MVVLLTMIMRFPAFISPKAIDDERIYSAVAIEMINGGLMYKDAVERKPPMLFWTYQAILEIGGDYNWHFLHIAGFVWILMTMWGIYMITEQLFGKDAGLVAALFYGVFVSWGIWGNLALNGEILMNLPIVWGIYFVLKNKSGTRVLELFFAGMLLCCAFLLKQPAAIMAVPLGIYLLSLGYRKKNQITLLTSLSHASIFTIGFATLLALVVYSLFLKGILAEAYYWTIGNHDIPHGIFDLVFWYRGIGMTAVFTGVCGVLVIGTAMSIKMWKTNKWQLWEDIHPEFWALVGLLIASLIGLSQPGRFYPHYYIQLVPVLCIFSAPIFSNIWSKKQSFDFWLLRYKPSQFWIAITITAFSTSYYVGLKNHWENSAAGQYLLENSKPTDKLFVWGQSTNLYLDAHRRAATRYVATFPLTGYIFGSPLSWDTSYDTSNRIVPGAWENLRNDFLDYLPDYIIDCDAVRNVPRYPVSKFPYLQSILENCYERETKTINGIIYKRKIGDCPQAKLPVL